MVRILVNPHRLTPAFMPVSVIWAPAQFESPWSDEGYKLLMVCRGARFHARKVRCEVPSISWRGWQKARGGLWILSEGVYEVRPEVSDPSKAANTHNERFTEAQQRTLGLYSHLWMPPRFED